ncbi:unnamed protein product [Orchesella dallaii]|uniref:NACHT domain-containing protein n=1 Tax=Orchesella dallaii TaxID=48710 RepID=A0ABP1RY75_9HEXA
MEDWQENHIRANLARLIKYTNCNSQFMLRLTDLISKEEELELKTKLKKHGRLEQSKLFLDIMVKKINSYSALATAYNETNQFGAFHIFVEGLKCHIESNGIHDVLPHSVIFQSSDVPLYDIIQSLDPKTQQKLAEKFLNDPISDLRILNSVPPPLEYYIPRKAICRWNLDPALFNKNIQDVFVIQGIQLYELSGLAKGHGSDLSGNQTETVTSRFILLEYERDFDRICQISTHPVHLLKYNCSRFIWVKTFGNISNLHDFINTREDSIVLNEETLLDACLNKNTPVCIVDTPGMGKTVLLATMAHNIMIRHPNKLVCFFVLREFVQEFQKRSKTKPDLDTLVTTIVEQTCESDFGKQIVQHLLKSNEQTVELIFDGFDEVLCTQSKICKEILENRLCSICLNLTSKPWN